ncbi:hypothetical protein BOX15_Mlig024321g2 [Macrostomum lignano]|uniref:Ig-like domain-containing protein n=1 Tax=Macrostomum lignano TaxID=282301 RepID=A0A267GVK6_9PLAT|nr:hypothetical protein BOX15_Mlig024321g2 [Macrostomum lignano]
MARMSCHRQAAATALLSFLLSIPGCSPVSPDTVSAPKTFFASREELVESTLSETVILPCTFVVEQQTQPEINVIWQKDKKTLTFNKQFVDDSRLKIVSTGIKASNRFDLQISEIRASDEGLYRCIASFGNKFFVKNVTLLVTVPPYIKGRQTDQQMTLIEGDSSVLECLAGGRPEPTVVWYKLVEPSLVKEMNRDKIPVGEGQRYSISNVTRQCQGTFICIASNDKMLPSASKRFNITVQYKPAVSIVNEEISQRRGLSTMVMCVITGNPLQEFYWEHRSLMFRPSGSGSSCESSSLKHCVYLSRPGGSVIRMDLLIRNLTAADFGQYFCVARSKLGTDRKSASVLEVEDAQPEITREPPQRPVSGQVLTGSDRATDATAPGNRHASSTLQGAKGSARSAGAGLGGRSLLSTASWLLLLLLLSNL